MLVKGATGDITEIVMTKSDHVEVNVTGNAMNELGPSHRYVVCVIGKMMKKLKHAIKPPVNVIENVMNIVSEKL